MTNPVCKNSSFSTTRLLFENEFPFSATEKSVCSGGIRKKGFIKKNLDEKPLITVITIVKNGGSLIARTIESVLSLNYDNIEYIIVDGNSSDNNTLSILKDYDDMIDFWISEEDNGISDAFNKGIRLAEGKWINFLNAGDYFLDKNFIEKALPCFLRSHIITGYAQFGKKLIPPKPLSNALPLQQKSKISHQASLIHRDVFQTVGYFNEDFKMRMDYELWLRALRKFDFTFIPDVFVSYLPGGVTSKNSARFYAEEALANKNHLPGLFFYNKFLTAKGLIKEWLRI